MKSVCILLLDGLGDRAYAELDGRTANDAANTPNLDTLVAGGSNGLLWPLGPGRAPSSELAHWAILGYRDPEFPGRAVLEALGSRQEVEENDVLAHAALRSTEERDGGLWITGRAEREDSEDAAILLDAVQSLEVDGLDFDLEPAADGEAILRIRGEADERVTDSDPFGYEHLPVIRPQALDTRAESTAAAAGEWTGRTRAMLKGHQVNEQRRERGAQPLDLLTLKWWGRRRVAPTFRERHGLDGTIIGASPFLSGLAELLGLKYLGCGETDSASVDLGRRLDLAVPELRARDFVLVHQKAVDEAGHTRDPAERVRVLESMDAPISRIERSRVFEESVVAITGDHATPASGSAIHTGDPVPFVLRGPGVIADRVTRFAEVDQASGLLGRLHGTDVMPLLLSAADRPLFLGSRPTPVSGADGVPAEVEPLEARDD